MIVSSGVDLFFGIFRLLFSGLELVGLPTDLIGVLGSILSYGVWIVGADIMGLFVALITGWWLIKFTVGIVVWVWELLPLT